MKQKILYITQNSSFQSDLTVLDDEGNPVDLTNFTGSMFISKYFGSSTKYAVPIAVEAPLQGILRISISSDSTRLLPAGTQQYSIFITETNGETSLVLSGLAIIIPTVF